MIEKGVLVTDFFLRRIAPSSCCHFFGVGSCISKPQFEFFAQWSCGRGEMAPAKRKSGQNNNDRNAKSARAKTDDETPEDYKESLMQWQLDWMSNGTKTSKP